MKNTLLACRSVCLIIVTVFCAAMNCTNRESKHNNPESVDASNDTCSVCNIGFFSVKQTSVFGNEKLMINRPVAIKFFNRVRLADKYEYGENENYDSLVKLLKTKHPRGAVQDLKDQYFYFRKIIEPMLLRNSVDVMDSLSWNRLLEFPVAGASVFVNPNDYKDQDGVLCFIPGKQPMFWTADREEKYCRNIHGIVEQYFLCPTSPN